MKIDLDNPIKVLLSEKAKIESSIIWDIPKEQENKVLKIREFNLAIEYLELLNIKEIKD